MNMRKTLIVLCAMLGLGLAGCQFAGSPPVNDEDICPVCKTKAVVTGHNQKGHPIWRQVHTCPECKRPVETESVDGKWIHRAKSGKPMDCKLCNVGKPM